MATGGDLHGNQDHYAVLGIERQATADDVRSAYRLRSHMFHPDKYETYQEPLRSQLKAEAAKEFKKLTAAYDVLRDPARRAAHDRQLDAGWFAGGRGPGGRTGVARRAAPPRRAAATVAEAPRETAGSERATGRRRAAPPPEPPRPRERDPLLVVRPERLDFGTLAAGTTKQLPLKISNAGGRTLFGEITSNRAWLSVSRRSFISSSALIFVSVDTAGLRPGEEYAGSLVVSTLNGGDQVVPVVAHVSGRPEPILAGAPSLLDFGVAQPGTTKARTIRLTNAGTGTLIGSVAVKGDWLAVSESNFRGNSVAFEVIAKTAGLTAGEQRGEVLIFSNGGQAAIQALVEMAAQPAGEAIVAAAPAEEGGPGATGQRPEPAGGAGEAGRKSERGERGEAGEDGADRSDGVDGAAQFTPAEQRDMIRRITSIEPQTVWERDFLRRIVQLVRAGERLAPGELAKIYEMEAQAQGA